MAKINLNAPQSKLNNKTIPFESNLPVRQVFRENNLNLNQENNYGILNSNSFIIYLTYSFCKRNL